MARKDLRRAKKDQVKRNTRRAAAGSDQELTPEEMAEVLQKLKVGPATGMDKHWCTGLLGAGGLLGEQARRRVKGDPVHREQWLAGIGMPDWQDCCYVAASLARVGAIDLFVPHLAMISKERSEAMQQSVNLGPTTMSRSQTIEARTGISLPLSAPRRTNAGGANCQSIVRMIQVLVENGGASEPVGRVQSTVLDADPALQVIPPIGAEGLNRRPPAGPCRLFLGPGFRLGARWNRLVETVKTRKKREFSGKKWARYGLRSVNQGS